ncbi:MAG TPA: BatA and WFA domain-containing protein, partial [Trueperaceae bacterium]|nr:BatA and WFA domain-containing protein [Trueperaceae bacterium]
MTFAQPAWLALLAVVMPLILLLHTRRRTDVVVPNLLIWRHVQPSGAAAPNPRRIRWRDRHLWLQLLVACLTALALAGPTLGRGPAVDHWIFLVDTSTSMNATDVVPSRFGSAVALLAERWGSSALDGQFSLVSVGSSSEIVAFRWSLGDDLRAAVDELRSGEGEPDWHGAALRAVQLAGRDAAEVVRVVVLTDPFGEVEARTTLEQAGIGADELEILGFGGPLVNVGVSDVVIAARGDGPDQWTVSGAVITDGFGVGDLVRLTVSFRFPGTNVFLPWGGAEVTLDGAGTGEFTIPLDLPGEGDLRVSGPTGDHLELDDSVTVVLRESPVRVAVMGPVPDQLLAALSAVGGVEAYSVERDAEPDLLRTYDLVIITEESAVVPQTSTLWLGSVPPGVGADEPSTTPVLGVRAGPHVLVADVDPSTMSIWRGQHLELLAGAEPLFSSDAGVLAWARTTSTGRQV